MNKELREDLEHLIICKDKSITQDLRDDVSLTLQYIDDLEDIIDKAIEYINNYMPNYDFDHYNLAKLLKILRGEKDESN